MDYTKKIMYQSNSWYNDGLRKAQVRDMSGAIVSLQQSLQYNRENIAARNLLGLVYYGLLYIHKSSMYGRLYCLNRTVQP